MNNDSPYVIRLTSFLIGKKCLGTDSYGGFNVPKKQDHLCELLKIRKATFVLPEKSGFCILKTYTTPSYLNKCTEFLFRGAEREKFMDWINSEDRDIEWPCNYYKNYYEAIVAPKNKDGSEVEIQILGVNKI